MQDISRLFLDARFNSETRSQSGWIVDSYHYMGKYFSNAATMAERIELCRCPDGLARANGVSTALSEAQARAVRSEEHTSELQSLMRSSYAVFCLKKKKRSKIKQTDTTQKTIT